MRIPKYLMVLTIVFASSTLIASNNDGSPDPNTPLLAKLSYKAQTENLMPHASVCISVWQDGRYRILRNGDLVGPTLLQGFMPDGELNKLKFLLNTPGFRALSDARGNLVRKEFVAEVHRRKGMQHVVLALPDEVQSFPNAAEDIIVWLQKFRPKNTESLSYTKYRDVCPQLQTSPYVPLAENLAISCTH